MRAIVTGAGGFIGSHLVKNLKARGYEVTGVDLKKPEFEETAADWFILGDLRNARVAKSVIKDAQECYCLAADMGGMGFISRFHAQILYNNVQINANTLDAAKTNGIKSLFLSSSACVYPMYRQKKTDVKPLKESDAYPAMPEEAYGWEKLISEKLFMYYHDEYKLRVRIARFHNIAGCGTWTGGREKAPAALCRKVAIAKLTGNHSIEIWGDGKATRSYCYIDDCLEGIRRMMAIETLDGPLNLGSNELISVDGLADLVADIAGIKIKKVHVQGPQGVRGRNSDNTLIQKTLGWQPRTPLEEWLKPTYEWIEAQVKAHPELWKGKKDVIPPP